MFICCLLWRNKALNIDIYIYIYIYINVHWPNSEIIVMGMVSNLARVAMGEGLWPDGSHWTLSVIYILIELCNYRYGNGQWPSQNFAKGDRVMTRCGSQYIVGSELSPQTNFACLHFIWEHLDQFERYFINSGIDNR